MAELLSVVTTCGEFSQAFQTAIQDHKAHTITDFDRVGNSATCMESPGRHARVPNGMRDVFFNGQAVNTPGSQIAMPEEEDVPEAD